MIQIHFSLLVPPCSLPLSSPPHYYCQSYFNMSPFCEVDTSTIPGEEVGLRLAHAAGFLPSSYMVEGGDSLRDIDELTQVEKEVLTHTAIYVTARRQSLVRGSRPCLVDMDTLYCIAQHCIELHTFSCPTPADGFGIRCSASVSS